MVWLHGGGFSAGSGYDTLMLDGENLARRGDVVVVSLNHRLNILGFLDLSEYGGNYANRIFMAVLKRLVQIAARSQLRRSAIEIQGMGITDGDSISQMIEHVCRPLGTCN
jgi:hypothetical protein